jgi:hypothetical protein
MNPMDLFNKNTNPALIQQMSALDVLLGGLGKQPAAKQIAPSLSIPTQKKSPQPLVQPSLLGGTQNG